MDTVASLAPRVISWWQNHGRHDLPWQNPRTPYRVWVSEVMLQQTQVQTAIPFFKRFTKHYPTLGDLAEATEVEVLQLWAGLGYYGRARNLLKTAKLCRDRYNADLPTRLQDIQDLPGIGKSTAGAILALGLGEFGVILDGNVRRVLARHFAVSGSPGSRAVLDHLWNLAEQETPATYCAEYAQGMMDLGATICTRKKPRCHSCPLRGTCRAYALEKQTAFPESRPPRKRNQRHWHFLIARRTTKLLFRRLPTSGVWGGLYCFPHFENEIALSTWCDQVFSAPPISKKAGPSFQHDFSHFRLHATVTEMEFTQSVYIDVSIGQDWLWVDPSETRLPPLPTPIFRLVKEMNSFVITA